jgi:hypothetical protein
VKTDYVWVQVSSVVLSLLMYKFGARAGFILEFTSIPLAFDMVSCIQRVDVMIKHECDPLLEGLSMHLDSWAAMVILMVLVEDLGSLNTIHSVMAVTLIYTMMLPTIIVWTW